MKYGRICKRLDGARGNAVHIETSTASQRKSITNAPSCRICPFFLPIPMNTTHDKQHCPEAALISKKVQEIENNDPNKRSSSSSDSTNKPPILKKGSSHSVSTTTPPTGPPVVK